MKYQKTSVTMINRLNADIMAAFDSDEIEAIYAAVLEQAVMYRDNGSAVQATWTQYLADKLLAVMNPICTEPGDEEAAHNISKFQERVLG